MRKLLLLGLTATAGITLAGCFGGDSEPTETPDETPTDVTVTLENVSAATGTGVGQIDIMASIKEELANATIHYIVTNDDAPRPSAAEVVAGTDFAGNTVHDKGSVTGDLDKTLNLTESEDYSVFFVGQSDEVFSEIERHEAQAKIDEDTRVGLITVDCDENTTTENDITYFNICTDEDLKNIGEEGTYSRNGEDLEYTMSANYIVGSDIDLTSVTNWIETPLGGKLATDADKHSAFKGLFDGNGFVISNLTSTGVATNGDGGMGMFAYVGETSGAGTIRNITADNFTINGSGAQGFGAVVGRFRGELMENITVTNSTITNSVDSDPRIGGVIGRLSNNTGAGVNINNLFIDANTTINGAKNTGGAIGMAGWDSNSDINMYITNVESHATVNGTDDVGGILGSNYGFSLENLVSYANVNGADDVGHVAGNLTASSSKTLPETIEIKNLISAGGTVVSTNGKGGIVSGALTSNVAVEFSGLYALDSMELTDGTIVTSTPGTDATNKNGQAITAAQLGDANDSIYANFDMEFGWEIKDSKPTLRSFFK